MSGVPKSGDESGLHVISPKPQNIKSCPGPLGKMLPAFSQPQMKNIHMHTCGHAYTYTYIYGAGGYGAGMMAFSVAS